MQNTLPPQRWIQRGILLLLTFFTGALYLSAQCTAEGGAITLADGSTTTTICVDGLEDPLTVLRDGNATADNTTFIITDASSGEILGIPPNNGPFDLDGAGPGVCTIWYLAYADGLTGLAAGNNVSDLAGCFDLSNGIDVDRQENIAGEITLEDGTSETTICVDGIPDPLVVLRDGTASGQNTTFVISDEASGAILAIPAGNGPFDLDGAGGGVCIIWYLAYSDGLQGLELGLDIGALDGCFTLSSCIFVNREENVAGAIALEDGTTEATICVDGTPDPLAVDINGFSTGANRTFFITDAATGLILGIPPGNGPFDLDGAGGGVCNIYYLAYSDGIEGLAAGSNIADLDGCFDLSNPIAVTREENVAGTIALEDGTTEATICVDGVADPLAVVLDGTAMGANQTFFITDAATGLILGIPPGNGPFDLDGAGGGVCNIYYLAFSDGIEGLAAGSNIADLDGCFDLSNPIAVTREENVAGTIALEDGTTEATICVDGVADPLAVVLDGTAMGTNQTFFITDAATGLILGIPPGNGPFDLDGAGGGVCNIYYLAYSDGIEGLAAGGNIADLDGCFDLSNPIAVTREENVAGTIALEDGTTEATICVDGVADPLAVVLDGTAMGANQTFFITDAATGLILGIPPGNGPFDLDGAGGGVCNIYYLAFSDGIEGLAAGSNIADLDGCFDLSNPIAVTREENVAGTIALEDGTTEATICVDGVADPLAVVPDGTAMGTNQTFFITDAATGLILGIPPGNGPFDLDGAGGGVCNIYYLTFSDGIEGLAAGSNIADLDGCFDLSNPIAVTREENVAGTIALEDGTTEATICVDGVADPLVVVLDGTAMGANQTFFITDAATGLILGIPPGNGPFDLDGAGDGICEIWYLAHSDGLEGLMVGNSVSDLNGCFSLSNPISVNRQSPDGGMVMTTDGATTVTATAGNVMIAVSHTTTATALSYWYIITDDNNAILGFANSAETNTLDLSGAPAGTCRIWGWSYRGEGDPVVGEDISTLADGACAAISDNFITVIRQEADCTTSGGGITLEGGATTTTICVDGVPDPLTVIRDGNGMGTNRTFVITDAATGEILGIPGDNGPFDLDGAGGGVCDIWYLSFEDGLTGLEPGNTLANLEGCFGLSNPIVVRREENAGGTITLEDGSTETSICVDGVSDPLTVVRDGNATGANRTFIITDAVTGQILGIPGNDGPFDLDGAGDGVCEIWYLAFSDGLEGLMAGNNVSDLNGCFSLSNPISVNRQSPDGGMVMTTNGDTTVEATAGDVMVEVSHTTTADALSYWYIITDDNNAILGFANSAETNTLDLSGAPAGTCRIWGWSYRGEGDPVVGEDISTLADGACAAISDNFITVIRSAPFAPGRLMLSEVTAAGEIEIFNGTDEAIDLTNYWLCNFPTYQQLSTLNMACGDLNLLPGEYLVVTGFDGFDAIDAELGLYRTNTFANPDAVVDYLEWGSTGHQRSSVAVAAGVWTTGDFEEAPTPDQSLQSATDNDGNEVWGRGTPTPCEANDLTSSTNRPSQIATARVFPNPVAGNFITVELETESTQDVLIQMLDTQGRNVGGILNTELTGKGNINVNLPDVPAGVYFLRVVNGQRLLTARFQKF